MKTSQKKAILPLLVSLLFICLIAVNLRADFFDIKPNLSAVVKHPFADNVWKGRFLFADFYDYMQFVDKYTPPGAVIMRMTQQSKWPLLSNDGFVRSFIYPRFTKEGDQTTLTDPKISYVFIHRAYSPPRVESFAEKWPTFPVKAEEIIYMTDNDYTKPPIILHKNYDPNDHTYDDMWGLIVLKR